MGNTKLAKVGIEVFVLPTPIGLDNNDLLVEFAFDKGLKLKKILEHIRLVM
jgi:hypothetical protein